MRHFQNEINQLPNRHALPSKRWTMVAPGASDFKTQKKSLGVTTTVERQPNVQNPKKYRVYILNDPFNKREYVIKVLLKVIPGLDFSRAYNAMQAAHLNGQGLVIVTHQELAEAYVEGIMDNGVLAMAMPDGK